MRIIVSNKIYITDPTQNIIDYCKKELVIDNPDHIKKLRMGKWIGNTPKYISLYEKDSNTLSLPFGSIRDIYVMSKGNMDTDFATRKDIEFIGNVSLYDYQDIAVCEAVKKGNGVIIGKCGSGKTQVGIALIQKLAQKTLWITHTHELLKQSKDRYIQYFGVDGVAEITAGKVDIGSKITFATVQTLSNVDLSNYADTWNVVIVDECHRLCGSPVSITMFYKVLSSLKARHKFGLTATSHRSDGLIKTMYLTLGDVAHEIPSEAVADKTMKASVNVVNVDFELSRECLDTDGTVIFAKAVNQIAFDETRNGIIAENIKQCKGHSCLVLSDRLDQLRTLKELVGHGVMIDGTMTSKNGKVAREHATDNMRSGKETVLYASYNLAKEGLDIPILSRLFMTTPKKDLAVVIQSVGRIERTFAGKTEAIVYDFVDSNWLSQNMYKQRKAIYKKNGNVIL